MAKTSIDMATDILLESLKAVVITLRNRRRVRLTTVMTPNQYSMSKKSIRRFQAEHKQILDNNNTR